MADDKLAELLKTQKSLTEWLEDINHDQTKTIRNEDNEKRERLNELNKLIGIPFDKPVQFEAVKLTDTDSDFQAYLKIHGKELCALRLIPKKPDLPKLRMRGKSIEFAYGWFKEQDINPKNYKADFVPHPPDYSWATIFIVNQHGIQGEIIYGGHHQLTQGFHDDTPPIVFRYDYKKWHMQPHNQQALDHLKEVASYLHVTDGNMRSELEKKFSATFCNDYLTGYFETTASSMGLWFIDYNQALGEMYKDLIIDTSSVHTELLSGRTGSRGVAKGKVKIVSPDQLSDKFEEGLVLVCDVTTPDFVPIMKKAAAIVTNQGGILSHAAIVARELGKPCVVGTKDATKILKSGQLVLVDADKGIVELAS